MHKVKITQSRLKKLLYYNSETGDFIWKVNKYRSKKGSIAGGINKDGYCYIKIDGVTYKLARLAFLYKEGYWPENEIDHINRITGDDRWINLRHVTRQCNMRNCGMLKNNTSGIKGLSWDKARLKWAAQIKVNGKNISVGRFRNKVDAANARWEAEKKYGFPNCNSTSSAYLYLSSKNV